MKQIKKQNYKKLLKMMIKLKRRTFSKDILYKRKNLLEDN